MADVVIMGLASQTYPSHLMGVYEWHEEHSGGERPVYKLQDDDDYLYLYYCNSEGEWWVGDKESMLGRKAIGMMAVGDKALTPDSITATWDRTIGNGYVQAPEVSVCCSRCCAFAAHALSICVSDSCAASHSRQRKPTGTAEEERRAACKAAGRGARQHHDGWSSGRASAL